MIAKLTRGRGKRALVLAAGFPVVWAASLIALEGGHKFLALLIGLTYPAFLIFCVVVGRSAAVRRSSADLSDAKTRAANVEEKAFVVEVLNDDRTPMELVVFGLESVFGMTKRDAITTMLLIHKSDGVTCAGFDAEATAKSKADELEAIARHQGFPLACVTRPGRRKAAEAAPERQTY